MVSQTSTNPIIPGFAPDPSAIYVDGWFFLVNSTFQLFPGLPVYASQDLSSWKHIGNAINRQRQLSLLKSRTALKIPDPESGIPAAPATGGLYAPTIRHHDGTFFIVCTNAKREEGDVTAKKENFILSTKDIWNSDWSDPVYFDFNGIDPSITFDDDGKVYIQGSAAPGPATRINNFEIDLSTGKRLSDERAIWMGTGGIYPEGPHVFKRNGWYHLIIAEGGTHETHSVTAARSRSIWGPYQAAPHNPILTASRTDAYIQHVGHCDVFEKNDKWWAVCLGVRNNAGKYVLSRETFLTTARWEDDWLHIDPVELAVKDHTGNNLPALAASATPGVDHVFLRDANLSRYQIEQGGRSATLTASSVDLSAPELPPTFFAKRQRTLQGEATATIPRIDGAAWSTSNLKCGLACYKDEHRFFRIFYDAAEAAVVFELVNAAQRIHRKEQHILKNAQKLSFQIEYTETEYHLRYTTADSTSLSALATFDTLEMTDPDFVGPIIGVFAVADAGDLQVGFEGISVE